MRYAVVLLLLTLLFVSLACSSAASIREIQEAAVALMLADGVDPATATQAQWDTYLDKAIAARRHSWLERVLGIAFPDLLKLWGIAAGLMGLGTDRGRANLAVIADPKTEWSETFRSVGALSLGLRSPDVAHEAAKKKAA